MQEYFEIGQIVNTFGVKGMVKVYLYTENVKRFEELKKVSLINKNSKKEYEIEEVKYHKNMVLIKFKGVDTVEQAEDLRNFYIQIERKDATPLEEGSYYIADLINLDVYTDEGEKLGILEDIFNTGSNDVYVVKDLNGKQILLPGIEDVIKEIDLKEGKILVHMLKGLR
mgnify:CR=1 FL=1